MATIVTPSPHASLGVRLKDSIKSHLDSPKGRWLLGLIASVNCLVKRRQFARVFFDDGVWVYQYRHGATVNRTIDLLLSLDGYETAAKDAYDFIYTPRPGDVVVDVGAGIGTEAYYYSRAVGARGQVISIEAHPLTYLCLEKFCQYNSLENVVPLHLAVGDRASTVLIDDAPEYLSSTTLGVSHGIEVDCRSLDDILAQYAFTAIDFLKMNIEGAERMAIQGMLEVLDKTRYVCICCHDFKTDETGVEAFSTMAEVEAFLLKHDFRIVSRTDDPRPWARYQLNAINNRFVPEKSHEVE